MSTSRSSDPVAQPLSICRGRCFFTSGEWLLDLPGSKLVVGDGHLLVGDETTGFKSTLQGAKRAKHWSATTHRRMFVLPGRTETFGLVMLEALAGGVPVAALPVPGPLDAIGDSGTGALDWDLRAAAIAALCIPRGICRSHAEGFSWQTSTEQFLSHVVPVRAPSVSNIYAEPAPRAGLV